MPVRTPQGFEVTSTEPIDTRLVLNYSDYVAHGIKKQFEPVQYFFYAPDKHMMFYYDGNAYTSEVMPMLIAIDPNSPRLAFDEKNQLTFDASGMVTETSLDFNKEDSILTLKLISDSEEMVADCIIVDENGNPMAKTLAGKEDKSNKVDNLSLEAVRNSEAYPSATAVMSYLNTLISSDDGSIVVCYDTDDTGVVVTGVRLRAKMSSEVDRRLTLLEMCEVALDKELKLLEQDVIDKYADLNIRKENVLHDGVATLLAPNSESSEGRQVNVLYDSESLRVYKDDESSPWDEDLTNHLYVYNRVPEVRTDKDTNKTTTIKADGNTIKISVTDGTKTATLSATESEFYYVSANSEMNGKMVAKNYVDDHMLFVDGDTIKVDSEKHIWVDGSSLTLAESLKKNATIIHIESEIALTSELLDSEIDRAKDAESKLRIALDSEILRAKTSELILYNDIVAEITRAENSEILLHNAIVAERLRAQTSEILLGAEIDAERLRAQTSEILLGAEIDAERLRAQTSEIYIYSNIGPIAKRAISSEIGNINARITSEIERAKDSELYIMTKLNKEIKRATDSETYILSKITKLNAKVDSEIQRAKDVEEDLDDRLKKEIIRATSSELVLRNAILAETNRAKAAEEVLADAIRDEAANRKTADDREAEIRADHDNELREDLNSEAVYRRNGDNQVTNMINTESALRANGDDDVRAEFAAADDAIKVDVASLSTSLGELEVKVGPIDSTGSGTDTTITSGDLDITSDTTTITSSGTVSVSSATGKAEVSASGGSITIDTNGGVRVVTATGEEFQYNGEEVATKDWVENNLVVRNVILKSDGGRQFKLKVSDSGVLSTEAV